MELRTARLRLREITEEDAPAINAHERMTEVMRYTPNAPRTLEETLARIRLGLVDAGESPRHVFDFAMELEGQLIGRVGCRVLELPSQGTIWWVCHPDHQGCGYSTEGITAVIDFAFNTLALHRVYAEIDPRNAASLRVAEKLGLRREAHLRECEFLQGEWVDTVLCATLAREWIAARPRG